MSGPLKILDTIVNRDCSNMSELPDNVIDLIVSSPPYWSLIDYSAFTEGKPYLWISHQSYDDYLLSLKKWHQEFFRVLRPGCVCVVVLGTVERDGCNYPIPFHALQLISDIGFEFQFEIIWNKVSGGRQSARNYIRAPKARGFQPNNRTEYLFVFKKSLLKPSTNSHLTISSDPPADPEFFSREIANNIWNISVAQDRRVGAHPCPFPLEIPIRLIELFSAKGETVLDPFMGSGTTAVAAQRLQRHFIGYEKETQFCLLARERLDRERAGSLSTRRPKIWAKYETW